MTQPAYDTLEVTAAQVTEAVLFWLAQTEALPANARDVRVDMHDPIVLVSWTTSDRLVGDALTAPDRTD